MRILLSSLLLIGGLNLILARHLFSSSHLQPYMGFNDYDYGLFNTQYNDEEEYKKFMDIFLGEDSNESIDKLPDKEMTPTNDNESEIEVTKSSEEKKDNIGNDDDDFMTEKDIEDLTKFLLTLPSIDDLNKIEEKTHDTKDDDRDNDDDLNEKEIKETKKFLNVFSTVLNMVLVDEFKTTKSSEEITNDNKDDDDNKKNDSEDNEKNDDKDDDNDDDILSSILNMILEDELKTTKSSEESNNENNSGSENKHDNDDKVKDDKTDDEDNNSESSDDNHDNDAKKTDSMNENEFSTIYLSNNDLHHDDDDSDDTDKNVINVDEENINRNYHKYDIFEEASQEFHTTGSSYSDETTSPPVSDYNGVQEYVEIRKKLDNLNDLLHENELNLDKDFYKVVSQDYNGDEMKKFEYDLNIVYENLNRIKRHFDAVQNVKSKLYFHNLVKAAVEKAHNKSKEERF